MDFMGFILWESVRRASPRNSQSRAARESTERLLARRSVALTGARSILRLVITQTACPFVTPPFAPSALKLALEVMRFDHPLTNFEAS
jgi:hypothetical protein